SVPPEAARPADGARNSSSTGLADSDTCQLGACAVIPLRAAAKVSRPDASPNLCDHASVLKFIEWKWWLGPISSFARRTPEPHFGRRRFRAFQETGQRSRISVAGSTFNRGDDHE